LHILNRVEPKWNQATKQPKEQYEKHERVCGRKIFSSPQKGKIKAKEDRG
jgi:hypothetical protein